MLNYLRILKRYGMRALFDKRFNFRLKNIDSFLSMKSRFDYDYIEDVQIGRDVLISDWCLIGVGNRDKNNLKSATSIQYTIKGRFMSR